MSLIVDQIAKNNHNGINSEKNGEIAMPALTIKNIPEEIYNELKSTVKQHHRSINSEVIMCLKRSLFPSKVSPEEVLYNIQALRSQIKADVISEDDVDEAINQGRP